MSTVVIVGNPKPASRTLDAATLVAEKITGGPVDTVIDIVDLGPALLGWGDDTVKAAVATVAEASVLVVASPTFKATYTGLLKLFLDQFAGGTGMRGVTAIPLMLGAGPKHALAPEVHLKPVLVELGATCPTPGLYLGDSTFREDPELDEFVAVWGPIVKRLSAGA